MQDDKRHNFDESYGYGMDKGFQVSELRLPKRLNINESSNKVEV